MADDLVLLERDGGLALLTLNRPDAYNAINGPMMEALLDALVECDVDDTVRAVLLTGSGKAFCAGGDLKAIKAEADSGGSVPAFLKRLTVDVHGAIATMARMEKPIIGAINGAAGGAGFSFALACDLVLAAESAIFTMAYTRAGLAPDGSSSWFLPRIVGPKRAYDLMVNNAVLTAAEARDLGIVNEVYRDTSFMAEAKAYAERIAGGPTRSFGAAKRLVMLSPDNSLETQMEYERQAIAECGGTEDFKEGVAAFTEKRQPVFRGK